MFKPLESCPMCPQMTIFIIKIQYKSRQAVKVGHFIIFGIFWSFLCHLYIKNIMFETPVVCLNLIKVVIYVPKCHQTLLTN